MSIWRILWFSGLGVLFFLMGAAIIIYTLSTDSIIDLYSLFFVLFGVIYFLYTYFVTFRLSLIKTVLSEKEKEHIIKLTRSRARFRLKENQDNYWKFEFTSKNIIGSYEITIIIINGGFLFNCVHDTGRWDFGFTKSKIYNSFVKIIDDQATPNTKLKNMHRGASRMDSENL